MDFWQRLLQQQARRPSAPPEPLSTDKIDAGYRLFWTKLALTWDPARRPLMAARVAAVIEGEGFEVNALERRFRVEGLDDQAHSGASLVALAAVLRGLEAYDAADEDA